MSPPGILILNQGITKISKRLMFDLTALVRNSNLETFKLYIDWGSIVIPEFYRTYIIVVFLSLLVLLLIIAAKYYC